MSARDRRENYLRAEVADIAQLTPSIVRVRFTGPGLTGFTTSAHPDQRIHLAFPTPGTQESPEPVLGDGLATYPPDRPQPEVRNYTVRHWDPETTELTVDFVRHPHGVAVDWLRAARPGAVLYVNADIGWFRPPADTLWYLLVADAVGLPALVRILDSLHGSVAVTAIVEVTDPGDIGYWTPRPLDAASSRVAADIRWLVRTDTAPDMSPLPGHVTAFQPPPGPGYVWAATEASVSRAIRKHVRGGWRIGHDRVDVTGYWRHDEETWLARYSEVAPDIESIWDDAIARGRSENEAEELCDEALERAGL